MAFISRKKIPANHKANMYAQAGFREKTIMRNANCVYTSNRGRCIEFLDTKTGRRCQYDKRSCGWTN